MSVEGVVVGDFEGPTTAGLQGFYLQDSGDGNDATSDGIFVFTGNTDNNLDAGDVVRVTGFARERFGQTTINGSNSDTAAVTNIVDCQATGSVPTTDVSMPFAALDSPERYEGMLVRFPQDLVIAEYFNYDQFGELVLALPLPGESRPFTPTAIDEPGAAANARNTANLLAADHARRHARRLEPVRAPSSERQPFSLTNGFRGGDRVQNTAGVLASTSAATGSSRPRRPTYTAVNPRPAAPEPVGGTLRAAAMNTLNFFITADYPTGDPRDNKCGAVPERGVPRLRRRPAGRVHPAARQARRGRGRRERRRARSERDREHAGRRRAHRPAGHRPGLERAARRRHVRGDRRPACWARMRSASA